MMIYLSVLGERSPAYLFSQLLRQVAKSLLFFFFVPADVAGNYNKL